MNPASSKTPRLHQRGFALIVTLSLMILLTVIAVGLLSLSGMTMRSVGQGSAMQVARANARLALFLAIGDLQRQLGPDTRISATADQVPGSDPSESATPKLQRQWAGAYQSWPAALPDAVRPEPTFLQWFVSGDPSKVTSKEFAETSIGSDSKNSVEIVSSGCVGPDGDPVRVPLLSHDVGSGNKGRFGWWVSDLGTKALIAPSKQVPTEIAETRADQQSAPGINLKAANRGEVRPFATLDPTNPLLANVISFHTSAHLADKPENIRGFFHDFTAQSRGLLTNVRAGGFRKDLSMELERPVGGQPSAAGTALYKVNGESGINLQELWVYYNLHKELRRTGSQTFSTGGSMSSGSSYLQLESSPTACLSDDEFHIKQPAVISYQMVLSYQTRVVNGANRLHLVVDPIVTFWNPLDVPVVVPAGLVMTVKFWSVPYDLTLTKNGSIQDCPVAAVNKGDLNFLSLEMGGLERIVMKPGEVLKMSQSGSTLAKSSVPEIHSLAGKKGFNFGSGVAYPILTRSGANIDVNSGDTLIYSKAVPNNLTDGATSRDGNVLSGGQSHSRHYALFHQELYLGKDRKAIGDSVGIGGAYLDWDFGNKRLAPGATRAETEAGTKPTGDRYYANQRGDVFKSFTDGRKIPTTGAKMPFMLLSFCAKTEAGSLLGTRTMSRFNPKALHVDFYDFQSAGSNAEREWLPFEFAVEPMNGWRGATSTLDEDPSGRGYFGGGMDAANGTNFVVTHSVPREPIVSLAAFQHSFANGFEIQKPKNGYAALNSREPLLPQISHAIGNSMACPIISSNRTQGTLPGGRPMADHSYLANQGLWDDWFLSGIAPQTNGFARSRNQKTVASEFFSGTGKLPVTAYTVDLRGETSDKLLSTYFSGSSPSSAATRNIASFIRVDGMFNVNSTSVEAWKSLLSGRRERPLSVRDANGKESIRTGEPDTPVSGLVAPLDRIAKGDGSVDITDDSQWVGRRTLDEAEIDSLARAIVKEVRKRGPFLSLADFINRRVGTDRELARSGAIQSALDSDDVPINEAYRSGSRATSGGRSFVFKEAETGPLAQGIPGIVKQADILTPIAPLLSARSDSFLIRCYGDKTDASGKVIARATCEAVVQRSPHFVDSTDAAEKTYASISATNKTFGRRFEIVSFRWLADSET
ncbi:MAG: hypothetical protein EOP88_16230 [Verrucomicrobiaceae bacterium]|nr:MAG: hypothetical protein EOP88_16230 [Verrucomicrobiaceae bacterium]